MSVAGWLVAGLAPWLLLFGVSRIERAIGRAGHVTIGGEGDLSQSTGKRSGANSGDTATPSPSRKRLFVAAGPGTPREPSAEHLLCAALVEDPDAVSDEAMGYLVRCAYGRKGVA